MRNHLILLLVIVILPVYACANHEQSQQTLSAAQGESTGTRGGGKGVLCTSEYGQRALQSLDRYEAIHVLNYSVPESQAYDAEKDRIVEKLLDGFGYSPMKCQSCVTPIEQPKDRVTDKKDVLYALSDIESRLQFIPVGSHLDPVDDAGKVGVFPSDCTLVQVVNFLDQAGGEFSGKILVDRQYWNLLTPQDQIAFLLHEWIYRALRNYGELTSERVRKIVGRLISSLPYPDQYEPLLNVPEALHCGNASGDESGQGLSFHVIPAEGGSTLVFNTLLSKAALASLTARSSISYQSWKSGDVNFTERLYLESFLGNRVAWVSMQSDPSTKPAYPGEPPAHWSIQFENNGKLTKATRFSCSNYVHK